MADLNIYNETWIANLKEMDRDTLEDSFLSVLYALNRVNLKKVGQLMNIPIGDSVSNEILPFIQKTLKEKEEMIDLLQKHVDYHADDEGEVRRRTSQEWFKLIDETSEYLKEITES